MGVGDGDVGGVLLGNGAGVGWGSLYGEVQGCDESTVDYA